MRAIYAGVLLGFGIASYLVARADHGRLIIPLAFLALGVMVAVNRED